MVKLSRGWSYRLDIRICIWQACRSLSLMILVFIAVFIRLVIFRHVRIEKYPEKDD